MSCFEVLIDGRIASMGPERKAPENTFTYSMYYNRYVLQWGRSERLRKTRFDMEAFFQAYGFNGAGAKGSGKRDRR